MHELGLAENTLALALAQAEQAGAKTILALNLRVGRLSGVDEEALCYALDIIIRDTPAESATIRVESVEPVCYCAGCAREFEAVDLSYVCPSCGALSANLLQGKELDLVSMEVD